MSKLCLHADDGVESMPLLYKFILQYEGLLSKPHKRIRGTIYKRSEKENNKNHQSAETTETE